jgi:hypothetical protein
MMVLIVPIFQVSTRTVKAVERKLSVYEAARNILDIIHSQIMLAVTNERGDQFSIKNIVYEDQDSFTPAGTTEPFRKSKRSAGSLQFDVINGAGNSWADWTSYVGYVPGLYTHPMGYAGINHISPEAYKASIRSTLAYPKRDDYDESGNQVNSSGLLVKTPAQFQLEQLKDVAQIELMTVLESTNPGADDSSYQNMGSWWCPIVHPKDPVPGFFAPGNETKLHDPIRSDIGRQNQRRMSGMHLMDFDISYWDEGDKKFKQLPENKALYFSPPPKAVRVTITVADFEKRTFVTLSRVTQVQTGCNPATGVDANKWIKPDDSTDYSIILPSNQIKDLKTLEPTLFP